MSKKKNISQQDLEVWENYIKNPKDIIDKDDLNSKKNINAKSKFKFDLHGFTLNEAHQKVKEIVLSCLKKGYREILFITGKGIHSNTKNNIYISEDLSKLRFSVPEFIKSDIEISKFISSISSANKNDGGEGVIVVKLKQL